MQRYRKKKHRNMKENYIQPTMRVIVIQESQMVCGSPVFDIEEGSTEEQDVDTRAHHSLFDIWSEE